MHESGEQQNHIPSLIHDRTVAKTAADFAREGVFHGLRRRVVPFEVMVAVAKVDVVFVEDGGPLERCGCSNSHKSVFKSSQEVRTKGKCEQQPTMLCLTRRAVAQFTIQRFGSTQFVFHFTTMTTSRVASFEMLIGLVDSVWCPFLPILRLGLGVGLAVQVLGTRRVVGHCAREAQASNSSCSLQVGRENWASRCTDRW